MLAYIHSYFAVIPSAIGNLESEGMELTVSLRIFLEVKSAVKKAPGEIGRKVEKKFEYVMRNNPGLERLLAASKVLSGDFDETNTPSPNVIAAYKYAPVVSCDVERSFSIYKNILAENRTNFTPKNLEMYIVCNCEANC
uniref:HAT C-terminal dimerisation domain-containing protein n=1 Tax=Ditylenchus dipsaci TaxID=166011 RepID=A0A915DTK8_9BILA